MTERTASPTLTPPRQPLPRHIAPMLAVLSEMPPQQELYGFEYKWDGVRALAYWDGSRLDLESRNLLDITGQYPELQRLGEHLRAKSVVLDGEIVAFNDKGRVSFLRLSHRMHVVNAKRVAERAAATPVTYMIFDVLHLDGRSLMNLPYSERRQILAGLDLNGPYWRTPPSYEAPGDHVLEAAREQRLEGIVAKRLDSIYEAGRRTGAWRKVKLVGRQEFVIGGWMPFKGLHQDMVGSLLVGYYDQLPGDDPDARLHYGGGVGTGFNDRDRRELAQLLKQHESDQSPFAGPIGKPGARFVRPELVAEVEYRGWGPSGALRQPSYKGLRTDKDPRQIVREDRWAKRR